MVQPIDTGYVRSLRCKIGHGLDILLMSEENLSKWEGNITATESKFLATKLISDAKEEILREENDAQRVGCFERTGFLIKKHVTP